MIDYGCLVLSFIRTDSQAVRNLLLFSVVAACAVFSFAMFALIARYLGPERFGRFAAYFKACRSCV